MLNALNGRGECNIENCPSTSPPPQVSKCSPTNVNNPGLELLPPTCLQSDASRPWKSDLDFISLHRILVGKAPEMVQQRRFTRVLLTGATRFRDKRRG